MKIESIKTVFPQRNNIFKTSNKPYKTEFEHREYQHNISRENYIANSNISFRGEKLFTPEDVFKNEVIEDYNYKKAKPYVTNQYGQYDERKGAEYLLALNMARAMTIKPIMGDYKMITDVIKQGSAEKGDEIIMSMDLAPIINQEIRDINEGKQTLENLLSKIKDKDIKARVAMAGLSSVENELRERYVNRSVDTLSDVYEISQDIKTHNYDLSDLKRKINYTSALRIKFQDQYEEVINDARMSNGKVNLDFLSIYIVNDSYHKNLASIKTFEKYCIDENGNLKEDEFAFYYTTQLYLKEETSDILFNYFTDKETGKLNVAKTIIYTQELGKAYDYIFAEKREREVQGLTPKYYDFDKIALNVMKTIK